MTFDEVKQYFTDKAVRAGYVKRESEWKRFKSESRSKQWIYLFKWADEKFSWGKATNSSDRIRKSSVLNPKLTGKYDRRVDYLMLKIIYGIPALYVFEMDENPEIAESEVKRHFGTKYCYRGFKGDDRNEISGNILKIFKGTEHYAQLSNDDKNLFDEYLNDVFFAKRRLPPNRTFTLGDSIEPNFLEKIDKKHLEPAIERVLKVTF